MIQAQGFDTYRDLSSMPTVTEETRFPYGWRYVKKRLPTGEEMDDQIPLTVEDLLNPQLGDQMPQRNEHFNAVHDLVSSLRIHYANDPGMAVFSDLIMKWGIPGLSQPAPDIAMIPNVTDKQKSRGSFDVIAEGTRPCLLIEVMSPNYPGDDTKKVTIYARAGVPEYFLIKPVIQRGVPHYELFGYRLVAGVYQRLPLDEQGRLFSQTLQLWFGVEDHGRTIRVTDARTGRRLLTEIETEAARSDAETAQRVAEARADAEAQARGQLEKRLQELEALLKSRS